MLQVDPKPKRPVLQRGHSFARGLVLAVPFWEGGGASLRDESAYQNHAPLSSPSVWSIGRVGPVGRFTGTEYGTVTYSAELAATTSFSISILFRTTSTGNEVLFEKDPGTHFRFHLAGGGSNQLQFSAIGNAGTILSTGAVNDGEFHMATGRYYKITGAFRSELYLDGKYQSSVEGAGTPSGTGNVLIGSRSGSFGLVGDIGMALYHQRALAEGEIASLHRDPWVMFRRSAWGDADEQTATAAALLLRMQAEGLWTGHGGML